MAFIGRLGSQTSYSRFLQESPNSNSCGTSDDDCYYTAEGIDQNNNDEVNKSPLILPNTPPIICEASNSHYWRTDSIIQTDYAKRVLSSKDHSPFEMNGNNAAFEQFGIPQRDMYSTTNLFDAMSPHCESDRLRDLTNTDASSCADSYSDINSPYDSSNDETDGEEAKAENNRRPRFSVDKSDHNTNNNNNKKKSGVSQNNLDSRSVNFRIHSPLEYRRRTKKTSRTSNSSFPGGKRHVCNSVQISSLRATSNDSLGYERTPQLLEYSQRLINPDGTPNIRIKDCGKMDLYGRYFSDIFTTLTDSSWSWVLFITILVYLGHWLIFGLLYWLFAYMNDDYAKIYGGDQIAASSNDSGNATVAAASLSSEQEDPCVFHVYDFVSAFLFSMESETTIGYGYRTITPVCPLAVTCLTLQCIISAVFDTWVIGMCYARIARPDSRSKTIMFAQKAVICKRDGKRCLLVRIANLRKSLLVSTSIRARMVSCRKAEPKEKSTGLDVVLEQHDLKFDNESIALLTAPVEYCHIIDKTSPLYCVRPDMYNSSTSNYFEIVVILTGTLESTGLTMQAQTSYLSRDIMNGYRFVPVVSRRLKKDNYDVNFKHFHDTVPEPAHLHQACSYRSNMTGDSRADCRRGTITTTLAEETEEEVAYASDNVFERSIHSDDGQTLV